MSKLAEIMQQVNHAKDEVDKLYMRFDELEQRK
jgi:ubiquinone biosynthesis protein UbiJ